MLFKERKFVKAIPVWEEGKQRTLNHAIRLETQIVRYDNAILRISGHTAYQIFINGEFIHWGRQERGAGITEWTRWILANILPNKKIPYP